MSFLDGVGTFAFAAFLAVVLWFGTKDNEGGKVGPLNWWACVLLALLSGAAFKAAGFPFDLISSLMNDGIGLVGAAFPDLTMPGLALILCGIAMFKKFSRRGISMLMLFFFYVSSGAGGPYGTVAERIAAMAQSLPS